MIVVPLKRRQAYTPPSVKKRPERMRAVYVQHLQQEEE